MCRKSLLVLIISIYCIYSEDRCHPSLPNPLLTLEYAGFVNNIPSFNFCTKTDDEIDLLLDTACNDKFPGSRNIRGVELENNGYQQIIDLPNDAQVAFVPSCECGRGCGSSCDSGSDRKCALTSKGTLSFADYELWPNHVGSVIRAECIFATYTPNTVCCNPDTLECPSIDFTMNICCNGNIAPLIPEAFNTFCCNEESYDPSNAVCCRGTVFYGKTGCCGSNAFDEVIEDCCDQQVLTMENNKGCCGGNVINEHQYGCCKGMKYKLEEYSCCNGKLFYGKCSSSGKKRRRRGGRGAGRRGGRYRGRGSP